VEGDDMDEPVADAVRGFLDGHIVLSRALANANHFPAVDVLDSISRLDRIVTSSEERGTTSLARNLLALYRDNEDLINVGAYVKNTNPEIDKAIEKHSLLKEFLKQDFDKLYDREKSVKMLQDLL
jgi:flagellum-specific ATP synthase